MSDQRIQRALLSVSNKNGLITFAQGLAALGIELISTGGTKKALAEGGLQVRDVSDLTGFPEMLDGRVKTLHPHVHGGILYRRDLEAHVTTIEKHGIAPIDLVVCNLYPFEATVAKAGASAEEVIENIDIGGPTLVRAAAKNFDHVGIVTGQDQYVRVLEELQQQGCTLSRTTKRTLAAEAFARIAAYDLAIADYFNRSQQEQLPATLHVRLDRKMNLRYGENPHQQAAFYVEPGCRFACLATGRQIHGKELSYNNLLDLDSALALVREFVTPAAIVIKHNNPCGAATARTLAEAYQKAHEGDPLSAYGGVLAFNQSVDAATAQLITEPNRFIEAIVAPDFHPEALQTLKTRPKWRDNVRLLAVGDLGIGQADAPGLDYRRIAGGLLVQSRDASKEDVREGKVVSQRPPTEAEWSDLVFAWKIVKHVKSNAIVFAKQEMLVGTGAGQMSRVDSVHVAGRKAGERSRGAVMASDAFFPFRDNVDEAARLGITAIVQPGGSIRDADSAAAADEHGMAMVCTGFRHFRH